MAGQLVTLPFRGTDNLEGGRCKEYRALETGADIQLMLDVEDQHLTGSDGGVSRFGLQTVVYCSPKTQTLKISIQAVEGHPGTTARFLTQTWSATPSRSLTPFQSLSSAFAELSYPSTARESGKRFAESAAQFDAAGDHDHAAIAWMLAARRAEVALDRVLAEKAFLEARDHARSLGWLRNEVVLLNDRALFIAAEDTPQARALVEESFTLQAKLNDPALAAAIQNNVCLLQRQFGDLNLAESCFARVLADDQKLGAAPAVIGAARNNWALVQLSKGQYARAATVFRQAAAERLGGGDKEGYVISVGNLALCLYQGGNLRSALAELHAAYKFATDNDDKIGRARIAEYLGAVYLAWGDSDTASAFAAQAESGYRENKQIAYLAPALRLRARIEAERGNLDAALNVIKEAWALANQNRQMQAVANIAGVYADVLLDRGDLDAAGSFVREASEGLGQRYEVHDRLHLRAAELRWLRLSGRYLEASGRSTQLLKDVPYPGLLRTSLLIERYLLDLLMNDATYDYRGRYDSLLGQIRKSAALAPDPDLAFRLLDVVRPAAEAVVATTLKRCGEGADCANEALMRALEFFSLAPVFKDGTSQVSGTDELHGLLQALSSLQARDDLSAASSQLKTRIKQLQSIARMRAAVAFSTGCPLCEQIAHDDTQIVYFFGSTKSWRWQRTGSSWDVRELPAWPLLAQKLQSLKQIDTRRDGLSALSVLLAGLAGVEGAQLTVGGDDRVSQVPFAALTLPGNQTVIDRYAVSLKVGPQRELLAPTNVAGFLGNEGTGRKALSSISQERTIVRQWSDRVGVHLVFDEAIGHQSMALLHISAHAQRDLGDGSSILWLQGHPILSYLFAEQPIADTVIINACESGSAPDFGLSQSTIAAGFLQAGARQVVATLFPIGDHVAVKFSENFYASYDPAKHNLAQAIRNAQLALRASPSSGYAWAAYILLTSPN
jgi:tetratricopeptide (TPR) repeat protein